MKKLLQFFIFSILSFTAIAQNRLMDTITFVQGGVLYQCQVYADSIRLNGHLFIRSKWTASGADIYYGTGNVGIGLTDQISWDTRLDVNGDIRLRDGSRLILSSSTDNFASLFMDKNNDWGYGNAVVHLTSDNDIRLGAGEEHLTAIYAKHSGDGYSVGINTVTPTSTLDVAGKTKTTTLQVGNYNVSVTGNVSLPQTPTTYEISVGSDGSNNWTIPFALKSTSMILYNTDMIRPAQWSGSGSTTLTVNLDTRRYDHLLIFN